MKFVDDNQKYRAGGEGWHPLPRTRTKQKRLDRWQPWPLGKGKGKVHGLFFYFCILLSSLHISLLTGAFGLLSFDLFFCCSSRFTLFHPLCRYLYITTLSHPPPHVPFLPSLLPLPTSSFFLQPSHLIFVHIDLYVITGQKHRHERRFIEQYIIKNTAWSVILSSVTLPFIFVNIKTTIFKQ